MSTRAPSMVSVYAVWPPPAPEPTTITSYEFLSASALVMNGMAAIVGAVPGGVIVAGYVGLGYAPAPSIFDRPGRHGTVSATTFTRRQILQSAGAAALPLGLLGCSG